MRTVFQRRTWRCYTQQRPRRWQCHYETCKPGMMAAFMTGGRPSYPYRWHTTSLKLRSTSPCRPSYPYRWHPCRPSHPTVRIFVSTADMAQQHLIAFRSQPGLPTSPRLRRTSRPGPTPPAHSRRGPPSLPLRQSERRLLRTPFSLACASSTACPEHRRRAS